MKPQAVFDILFVGQKLQSKIQDFSLSEINFFSYLGCLLSLYDGNIVANWGYNFIKNNLGSPFSSDLNIAIDSLVANGTILKSEGIDGYYRLSPKGVEFLEVYSTLQTFKSRITYLNLACRSISLFPLGYIKEAINNEPVLKSAFVSSTKRSLLEENSPATKSLYHQFALLKTALEDKHQDLMIPAIVWIESLQGKEASYL